MRKEKGRSPLLDAHGLRALKQHCISHRHDSIIDITKWAQEYFQKRLSVKTIHLAMCSQLKLYHDSCKKEAICEYGPEAPSCPVGQGLFKMDCFKVEKGSMVRQIQIWHFFLEITDAVPSGLKRRETFQCVISVQFSSDLFFTCASEHHLSTFQNTLTTTSHSKQQEYVICLGDLTHFPQ